MWNDDELLLLYDLSWYNNLDLPYDFYSEFNFDDLKDDEWLSELRFHRRDLPFLPEFAPAFARRYPFVPLGGERHCESIKSLSQEHNAAFSARARALIPTDVKSISKGFCDEKVATAVSSHSVS